MPQMTLSRSDLNFFTTRLRKLAKRPSLFTGLREKWVFSLSFLLENVKPSSFFHFEFVGILRSARADQALRLQVNQRRSRYTLRYYTPGSMTALWP